MKYFSFARKTKVLKIAIDFVHGINKLHTRVCNSTLDLHEVQHFASKMQCIRNCHLHGSTDLQETGSKSYIVATWQYAKGIFELR